MNGTKNITVIGAGPTGLFASWLLLKEGFTVHLYDRNKQAGVKLLLAGATGLNITSCHDPEDFSSFYGPREDFFEGALKDFSAADTINWLHELGEETFTGSGEKVFPQNSDTRELRDRWLGVMERTGRFYFHGEHLLVDWQKDGLYFLHQEKITRLTPEAGLFALGGASWPGTGSDGSWSIMFRKKGIPLVPFKPMNCSFLVEWTPHFLSKFIDTPLKNISVHYAGDFRRGDLLIRDIGLEGGPLYYFSRDLVNEIEREGRCPVQIDLTPDLDHDQVFSRLKKKRGKSSLSTFLRRELHLSPLKISLLHETKTDYADPSLLARHIKEFPVILKGTDRLEKAISTMGGVDFSALDENLMFRNFPGFFAAGEMADWDSPTGGYLLQGCFTTAFRAVKGIKQYYEESTV